MFFKTDPDWSARCDAVVREMIARHGHRGLDPDRLGFVALRENDRGAAPDGYAWRGDWRCYPCSVVKAFHLVHALHAIEAGRVEDDAEFSRALRDMILWSSNTATNYIIDLLTKTTGDTVLAPAEFDAWRARREVLNGFFEALGWPEFAGCNISQKLMDDRRYGREAQYAGPSSENLNALTPLAAARLFFEIFAGDLPLSREGRARAQATLLRDRRSAEAERREFQVESYLGGGVPLEATLWSKAGRTVWIGDMRASFYKHDVIRIVLPGRAPLVLCLMTQGKAIAEDAPEVFPEIGRIICDGLID